LKNNIRVMARIALGFTSTDALASLILAGHEPALPKWS